MFIFSGNFIHSVEVLLIEATTSVNGAEWKANKYLNFLWENNNWLSLLNEQRKKKNLKAFKALKVKCKIDVDFSEGNLTYFLFISLRYNEEYSTHYFEFNK